MNNTTNNGSHMDFFGEYVYGYVNGERYNIENTPEQITAFIIKYRSTNVKIVSQMDVLLITTLNGFLEYIVDQDYRRTKLMPVLVPMQMGEVEIEFKPFSLSTNEDVIASQENVELHGTKFNVVVTNGLPIIHLLELEGPTLVTDVINSKWQKELIQLLDLPSFDEDYGDDIFYQIYCYCYEGPVILEFSNDSETGPQFTLVDQYDPIWPAFFEVLEERQNQRGE